MLALRRLFDQPLVAQALKWLLAVDAPISAAAASSVAARATVQKQAQHARARRIGDGAGDGRKLAVGEVGIHISALIEV